MDRAPEGLTEIPVAVIDDDQRHRWAMRRLLQNKGFSVREFESPDDAVRAGALFACELILLDLLLGGENGVAACRCLRELGYSGGIIVISGVGQSEVKAQALDAGADDYVTKPADGKELRARLRAVHRRLRPFAGGTSTSGPLRAQVVLAALKSPCDRRILRQLVAAKGAPVERDDLKALGLENLKATDKALEKHIERMRLVLEPLGVRIETVVGTGYSCPTRFD